MLICFLIAWLFLHFPMKTSHLPIYLCICMIISCLFWMKLISNIAWQMFMFTIHKQRSLWFTVHCRVCKVYHLFIDKHHSIHFWRHNLPIHTCVCLFVWQSCLNWSATCIDIFSVPTHTVLVKHTPERYIWTERSVIS